jgi:hypothetical protein
MMLSASVISEPNPIFTQYLSAPYKNELLKIKDSDFGLYI